MGAIIAGSSNGKFPSPSSSRLEALSVLVNNACNLACRHCYLEAPRYDRYLTHEEWRRLITSALADLRPSTLAFVGKEVFLSAHSARVLFDALRIRRQVQQHGQRTEIGVITNGTLLHRHRAQIEETPPDYIDISIDGLPAVHDAVRGAGAFDQVRPNLEWLADAYPGNVWLAHTLFDQNIRDFVSFVSFYNAAHRIRNFSVGFYRPQAHTDQSLMLWEHDVERFVADGLARLTRAQLDRPATVVVHVDSLPPTSMELFSTAGWINSREPLCAEEHGFENGLTLRFHKVAAPIGLWQSARITPEGYWLGAEDVVRTKEYEKYAVARAREYDFDARKLYAAGLASDRLQSLLGGHVDPAIIIPTILEPALT